VDTLIVVSNDKLLQIVPPNTPLRESFLVADDILRQGVVGISEIIVKPGLINVDFADVRAVMVREEWHIPIHRHAKKQHTHT